MQQTEPAAPWRQRIAPATDLRARAAAVGASARQLGQMVGMTHPAVQRTLGAPVFHAYGGRISARALNTQIVAEALDLLEAQAAARLAFAGRAANRRAELAQAKDAPTWRARRNIEENAFRGRPRKPRKARPRRRARRAA